MLAEPTSDTEGQIDQDADGVRRWLMPFAGGGNGRLRTDKSSTGYAAQLLQEFSSLWLHDKQIPTGNKASASHSLRTFACAHFFK
jgi:hypothetical protein